MIFRQELPLILQAFDGLAASADQTAARLVEFAKQNTLDIDTLYWFVATGLRAAYLMGCRVGARFEGDDQVRTVADVIRLQDALRAEQPHNPEEDAFIGTLEDWKARAGKA